MIMQLSVTLALEILIDDCSRRKAHNTNKVTLSPVQTNIGNERLYPPVSLVTLMKLLYLLHIPGHLIQATAHTSLLIQRVSPGLAGEKKTLRCMFAKMHATLKRQMT